MFGHLIQKIKITKELSCFGHDISLVLLNKICKKSIWRLGASDPNTIWRYKC